MKRRLSVLMIVTLVMMLLVSACGSSNDAAPASTEDSGSSGGALSSAANTVSNSVAYMLNGNVKGEVGKAYSTRWFEFTIKSINQVDAYAGYEPAEGYQLYDVVVYEKSTFDEAIPMGTFDFYMDEESWPEYVWPLDPIDDTMMPVEYTMEKGDEVEYHMVFEVPAEDTGITLHYTEYAEDETEYATFTITIN